ncbi:Glycosyl transferase family 2 [Brevinema andersonii]|uniref:Glycosyl transferase family 2 n=1 Tax=Brevinema andersonii TaxID=34097 RepID=A0A1I1EK47_BREAD|nr:glycosyltransferase family 2 protein [Brevinema andersonii]SFB85330.1 Glycosyl transferase family 2 [Brevinema andersonii]
MIPKISIIVIVYNTEKYLPACIDSLLNQTLPDIEIIVVDDCSPGKCIEIIKEYQKKDKRIHLISHSTNKGSFEARKTGIKAATGEYIQHIDSDDWLELNACEKIYDALTQKNQKLDICCIGINHNEGDKESYPFVLKNTLLSKHEFQKAILNFRILGPNNDLNPRNTLSYGAVTYIIKREKALEAIYLCGDTPHLIMMEDFLLVSAYLPFIDTCICLDDRLYHYRLKVGVTSTDWEGNFPKYFADACYTIKKTKEIFQKYDIDKYWGKTYNKMLFDRISPYFRTFMHFPPCSQKRILNELQKNNTLSLCIEIFITDVLHSPHKFQAIGEIKALKLMIKNFGSIFYSFGYRLLKAIGRR